METSGEEKVERREEREREVGVHEEGSGVQTNETQALQAGVLVR